MRIFFTEELLKQAKQNSNIILLTADLGFSVFEEFASILPKQYLNTGCSEANTVSMAAGLALSGKKVFIYSIVPFITMRCFEQIRVDVCMHQADVTLVGVGGGLAYGQLGPTHHAIEDIAILRALPNMYVICPGDPMESRLATRALIQARGPAYLRLNKKNDPQVHLHEFSFEIGKAIFLRNGKDVTLISTGSMLPRAIEVATLLEKKNITTTVLSMLTVKPLDTEALGRAVKTTSAFFTLEEHSVIGGLGGAVAEYLSESPIRPRVFHRFGIQDRFTRECGDPLYLHRIHGLTAEQITDSIVKLHH
jgi:transketolase